MSSFNDRIDEEYNKSVEFVLCYAESLGAEYVCTGTEQFTTVSGGETIREKLELKIYRFGDEFFSDRKDEF